MSKESLGGLVGSHIPQLRRYARALIHNPEEADDLVQDCLERAWCKAHLYEPGTNLRAWLFTLMHNLYVNGLRRKQLKTESMTHKTLEDTRQGSPEAVLDLRDLETGLERLPAEQREALLLVCLEEMSYEQVAKIVGVPVGTVMSRLHRARKALRTWMAWEQRPALRRVK